MNKTKKKKIEKIKDKDLYSLSNNMSQIGQLQNKINEIIDKLNDKGVKEDGE